MKLLVRPIYGWGWFDAHTNSPVEVPVPFELEVKVLEAGEPFASALGQLEILDHPLSGQWIWLWQRHRPSDGACNLRAFFEKPVDPASPQAKLSLSGFAEAKKLSD